MSSTAWSSLIEPLEVAERFPPAWGVEVWKTWLGEDAARKADIVALLSEEERCRAAQLKFDNDRRRFEQTRACLRILLAGHLDASPAKLQFDYGPQGKPSLCGTPHVGLQFNVSHSGDWAVFVLAPGRRVGIDVERIRPGMAHLAQRNFSANEINALQSLPPNAQDEAFFRCWTRKEAYLKAHGCGLSLALDSFEVSLTTDNPAIVWSRDNPLAQQHWQLAELRPAAGYLGALAVETLGKPTP